MTGIPYTKSAKATAKIGEVQAMTQGAVFPALLAARFALIVSVLALLVASVALAVAIRGGR